MTCRMLAITACSKARSDHIQSHIKDVDAAIKAVRTDLINQLPKMRRSGKVITKDLAVTVMVATEQPVLAVA